MLVIPREGVRLGGSRSLDDGSFLIPAGRAAVTRLGIIELARDYKLGSGLLKKGLYSIVGFYDPKNELDAKIDPKNETDSYLVLMSPQADGRLEAVGFIGLPQKELAFLINQVDPQIQVEFAVAVLLNLVAALLQ